MKTIKEAEKELYEADDRAFFSNEYKSNFKIGVEFAQRWIPVEEELPPIDSNVILKFIGCRDKTSYWVGVLHNEACRSYYLDRHLKFTHWRPIELL